MSIQYLTKERSTPMTQQSLPVEDVHKVLKQLGAVPLTCTHPDIGPNAWDCMEGTATVYSVRGSIVTVLRALPVKENVFGTAETLADIASTNEKISNGVVYAKITYPLDIKHEVERVIMTVRVGQSVL